MNAVAAPFSVFFYREEIFFMEIAREIRFSTNQDAERHK